MEVYIGSRNPVKIKAVEDSFKALFSEDKDKFNFSSHSADSEVPDQPIGIETVVNGAENRARNVRKFFENQKKRIQQKPETNNPEWMAVGIEAGLVKFPGSISGYLDFQFCAILDNEGHISIGSGSGIQFPRKIIQPLIENPKLELAEIMGKVSGDSEIGRHGGAIGYYSEGKITRYQITRQSVEMALIPLLNQKNKHEYFD